MDEKQMHDIIAQNINMLLNSDIIPNSSVRNLSTCLGANDSYIQKIMNKTSFPSFQKLIALSNHFEREPWTFLYDTKHNPQRLELLKLINDSPDAILPIIIETIKMLNNQLHNND